MRIAHTRPPQCRLTPTDGCDLHVYVCRALPDLIVIFAIFTTYRIRADTTNALALYSHMTKSEALGY